MKSPVKISVIGGDTRQIYTAARLHEIGFDVCVFGFELNEKALSLPKCDSLEKAMENDIIVLPLPCTKNNRTLNASFSENELPLSEIIRFTHERHKVFLGMGNEQLIRQIRGKGAAVTDYFSLEELTIKNALLTAEGVLSLILEKLPVTVWGLKAAVTGYGRVGYYTCRILSALGAELTVFARSKTQLAKAQTAGFSAESLECISEKAADFDIIINTVPAPVISEEAISRTKEDCVMIETASAPYGIDFSAVQKHGRTLIKAFSLPGKTAPKTAGFIIADTISEIIKGGA